jgi:hypothetical protein
VYSTCLFCNRSLGANQLIEEFPVGRRLAFDAQKGRLWVVCRSCERWNLSPLTERWEAIEAAERIFRDTRMRVSTEHIGLARHREGLELVRIGQPQRPEFAAWRYGDQFGRRRRRAVLIGTGVVAVLGTVATAGLVTGVIGGTVLGQSGTFFNLWTNGRTLLKLRTGEGEVLKLKRPDIVEARLRQEGADWTLTLGRKQMQRSFSGAEAQRVAGLVMPKLNSSGGGKAAVQEAVREIESAGGSDAYIAGLASRAPLSSRALTLQDGRAALLGRLPTSARLALEMALHEEQERRALEGELKGLELAWREAEEVAAISDDLLLPPGVRQRLARPDEPQDRQTT